MRRNRLRERLRAGRPSLGTHVHSAWPAVVELVGHTGLFDYVEFVGEYAPYDLFALENLARAVDTFDHMTAMFKVEQQPITGFLHINNLFDNNGPITGGFNGSPGMLYPTPTYADVIGRYFTLGVRFQL